MSSSRTITEEDRAGAGVTVGQIVEAHPDRGSTRRGHRREPQRTFPCLPVPHGGLHISIRARDCGGRATYSQGPLPLLEPGDASTASQEGMRGDHVLYVYGC